MRLNDYTKHIMAEYIKDMYDAGMISKYGGYTEKANEINRRLPGRDDNGFCDLCEAYPLNLEDATSVEVIVSLFNGRVWVTKSVDGRDGSWWWHSRLPQMEDEQFLELINNNRELYGLSESRYTQSEMSKAARLLDDEMQYEI